ncbi:hypothetical protein [Candidatus Nitronereus thalassa]|uniref:Porin n=1 Tax=Candidatus Nitronereus thalassa TaxID=3020898 RepID=A0ABU3K9G8_9BACT|nr:hypothetical protein [Candidatus Nitronereus thalassa]MDT7043094.1 hypothetical protein [Candidatus Nitronereus thalassa]
MMSFPIKRNSFVHWLCAVLMTGAFLHSNSNNSARAETPSPGVHWGAMGFPDQQAQVATGINFFRFTEFNGEGQRFNDTRETIGLNFGSISWTQNWTQEEVCTACWQTNLTVSGGPTSDEPTKFLQNEFVHDFLFDIAKVPVGGVRTEFDFMVDGSLTKWVKDNLVFAGLGFSTGTLYHEVWGRAGVKHWAMLKPIAEEWSPQGGTLHSIANMVRVSGLGRYGRVFNGAAFEAIAPQSFIAQGKVSLGWFDNHNIPICVLFGGITIDSGIFVDIEGDALEERYYSLGFQIHRFTFETWNDQINKKDFGPTYGTRVTFDFYPDWLQGDWIAKTITYFQETTASFGKES